MTTLSAAARLYTIFDMSASGRHWGEVDMLTVKETAAILRVSTATIYRALRAGRIGYLRLEPGGPFRIPAWELDKLVDMVAPRLVGEAEAMTQTAADREQTEVDA